MLCSMTGHGQASVESEQVRVVAEFRTVNNRFLKTSLVCDLDAARQTKLENLIKAEVQRGSVSLRLKVQMLDQSLGYRLNSEAVRAYWLQLSEIAGGSQSINVESVLKLPGVVAEGIDEELAEAVWPLAEQATREALTRLNEMRSLEGGAMQRDIVANLQTIATELEQIKAFAPRVIENYARRMTDRINGLLQDYDVSVTTADIVKEVGVFAEKCDVSEETVRLGCHLEQFGKIMEEPVSNGKKLDFLVQEMLRETNTIGSKANDVEIAKHVIEIKTLIERIREMVQNVE